MSFKKVAYSTNYLLLVAITLGILGAVNYFGNSVFNRWDLTEQQLFTVSEPTRKILKELDDVVSIKAYFSKDLPPYVSPLKQQVKDMLDEYLAYSGNKLSVEFIDPADDPDLQRQVQQMGIPRIQLNIIEKDQAQVKNAYMGVAVFYEDKTEVIPMVQDTTTLEYELTAAIKKVTADEIRTIGWLTPDDERLARQYNFAQQFLGKEYQFRTLDDLDSASVPAEINTLIVPQTDEFSERAKYELDQFIMRGGKLFLLVNSMNLKQGGLEFTEIKGNLNELLANYGVKLRNALVLDKVNAQASFNRGRMTFSMPYPYWVRMPNQNLAQHPALKRLEGVVFPWTSPLELVDVEGIEATALASSSAYAWVTNTQAGLNLSPQQRFRPPQRLDSYPLAVLLNGEFNSFYKDKKIPSRPDEDTKEAEDSLKPAENAEEEKALTKSPATQIIVVGNPRFLEDNFLRMFRANQLFFLNLVDWLNVGDELIQIRARQVDERPLKEISEQEKSYVRFFNTFGVSLLVIVLGLLRYKLKRVNQQKYESGLVAGAQ